MAEDDFSLVIINAPLRMSRGSSWLCGRLKAPTRACCFWLKRKLRTRFRPGGGQRRDGAAKAHQQAVFLPVPEACVGCPAENAGTENENTRLQKQIDDIRLVDRAKCVLIQYSDFTEQQAHRYIEKKAMDQRVSRREVAEDILRIYEADAALDRAEPEPAGAGLS